MYYHNDVQNQDKNIMQTVGIRALRTNPGLLSNNAKKGVLTLVTNHSIPVSLSIPFDSTLLVLGVHILLAIKLFEEGILTLPRAAKLANLSTEVFLSKLAVLGVIVVDQSSKELDAELKYLE